jgi:phage tail-like protein
MATPSEYLRYLPEILRGAAGDAGFLGGYLKIFEALLSGRDDLPAATPVRSLEGTIAALPALLDPGLTPVEPASDGTPDSPFLDYLGRWVALTFDQNWGLDKRRQWLRRIVPLYKRRGTRAALTEYLAMFVGNQVHVDELPGGFIVGRKGNATVGVSSFIAGAPAYFFRVRINYGFAPDRFDIDEWKNVQRGTRAIVDLEKPAHTYYTLGARTPGIIVGRAATIARDTLIWQDSKKIETTG